MPTIDLSTLEGPELRRLLDSARRQGQAAQTYEILQEMEARRQSGPRPKTLALKRPPRKAHTITLALGDPLDLKDDPLLEEPLPEDPLLDHNADDLPPLTLTPETTRAKPREPAPETRRRPSRKPPPPAQPPAARRQGWAHWGALIFALGLAGGVAGGWWASDYANGGAPAPAASPAPPAGPAAVQTAALAPAVPPANADTPVSLAPEPAAGPSPMATQVPPPPAPPEEAVPATTSPPAATAPAQTAETTPVPAQTRPAAVPTPSPAAVAEAEPSPAKDIIPAKAVQPASTETAACGSKPADRAICADPKLRHLQGELRQAYAEALKAHEDKTLLRQRELAWADARDNVTDPVQLASLYRERIGKLRAATADALRQRHQPATAAAD